MLFGLNNSCQDCSTVPSKPIQNRKINGPLSCTQVSVLITEAERPGLLKFKLSKYKSGAFLKQCHSFSFNPLLLFLSLPLPLSLFLPLSVSLSMYSIYVMIVLVIFQPISLPHPFLAPSHSPSLWIDITPSPLFTLSPSLALTHMHIIGLSSFSNFFRFF